MSHILSAAPVTSNIVRWDAHHHCLEETSSILFGAVWLRAVRTVMLCCSTPLGELEPLHRERWSRSRLYHVQSCSAQSCLDSFILLLVPSERMRAVTQGDCIIFCAIPLILLSCCWNKTFKSVVEKKKTVCSNSKLIYDLWAVYFVHLEC